MKLRLVVVLAVFVPAALGLAPRPGATAPPPLVNPAPGRAPFVGANFWNLDWEGPGDFFVAGVDFSKAANPWRADFLAELAPYRVLRFMDWNDTNARDNRQARWDTRARPDAPPSQPVAYEWQIDLCNRAKKDLWLTVPFASRPEDWTELARLVRDRLDPRLRVYVEWSNEVWNAGFPARADAEKQGRALGLRGAEPAAAFTVYESVRLYEAFAAVLGRESPRLVRVLSGQAAWTGPCEAHLAALGDRAINPRGARPDVYAIAPYFSGNSIPALEASLGPVGKNVAAARACAAKIGVPLVSYEAGSDSFAAPNHGCEALQRDPRMHDLYLRYLDTLTAAGLSGPIMQYTHAGPCWGLEQKTGDPVDGSPKYRAVLEWAGGRGAR